MSFDALRGLKEAIAAKEKKAEPRRELTDYAKEQIDHALSELQKGQRVTGTVMKVDAHWKMLFVDQVDIDFSNIYEIIKERTKQQRR